MGEKVLINIKTFVDVIDATFIKIIMLHISPIVLYEYCEKIDSNFKSEYEKIMMYDMIDKTEYSWIDKEASKFSYIAMLSWLKKRDQISVLVSYLNEDHGFNYYYPKL